MYTSIEDMSVSGKSVVLRLDLTGWCDPCCVKPRRSYFSG